MRSFLRSVEMIWMLIRRLTQAKFRISISVITSLTRAQRKQRIQRSARTKPAANDGHNSQQKKLRKEKNQSQKYADTAE